MGEIFGNDKKIRGCFMVHRMDKGSSRGAVVNMPTGGPLPGNSYSEPILCTGFDFTLTETVLFNRCFGNRTYTYAFGHDPNASVLNIHLLGFLINPKEYSGIVDKVVGQYRTSRISESKRVGYLSLGSSKPLRGFVVGMSSQSEDPQHSLQQFTIRMACPKV